MVQRYRLKCEPIGDNHLCQIPVGDLDTGIFHLQGALYTNPTNYPNSNSRGIQHKMETLWLKSQGSSHNAIEALCRAGAIRTMDTITKQLNPALSYQLNKFRSSADDSCEEVIVLS